MCDDLYPEKLSKFKKIKNVRDAHYIFMACVSVLIINNNNNNVGTKDKLDPILKIYFNNYEKNIIGHMNWIFSDKILLNTKIINKYKKIDTNRLLIVINELYKEVKTLKKITNVKCNEFILDITKFFDKANEREIGAARNKKTLDELLRLYNKVKNNEPDTESESESESETVSQSVSEFESESENVIESEGEGKLSSEKNKKNKSKIKLKNNVEYNSESDLKKIKFLKKKPKISNK